MLLEILITFEILAFVFLALGIVPFKRISDNGNLPLVNKLLFIFVSAIIFFSLAVSSVNYDYTYCYINQTTLSPSGSVTYSTATCDSYTIEDQGISYMNWGMGILSSLVGTIMLFIVGISRHDDLYNSE